MGRKIGYIILVIAVTAFLFYLEEKQPEPPLSMEATENSSEVQISAEFGSEFLPKANGQLIIYKLHALSYLEEHEQAEWVAYSLRPEHLSKKKYKRPYFEDDPAVKTGSARFYNYKNSAYNKGHLLPAADRKQSVEAYNQTFLLSNVSPQDPGFNSGIWNRLEQKVRYWAKKHDGVYLVTGGVLTDGLPSIGEEEVSVPAYFYKIVVDNSDSNPRAIAFLIPNEKLSDSFYDYVVTIDRLEEETGIDFFVGLNPEVETKLEGEQPLEYWKEEL